MRIGPEPLFPLNPLQPDRSVDYPRALGAEFVGKPRLQFPEVKIKPPVALEPRPSEPLAGRGALIQVQPARSTTEPSGPLGLRVDLLA